jgi:hypothetical protein
MKAGLLFFLVLSVLALSDAASTRNRRATVTEYNGVTVNTLDVEHPHHKEPQANSFSTSIFSFVPLATAKLWYL